MRADLAIALEEWISADRADIIKYRDKLGDLAVEVVLCMGVLVQMPLAGQVAFYELYEDRLASTGCCIADVTVEIGPTILGKESARVVLKGRAHEDFMENLAHTAIGVKIRDQSQWTY